MPFCNLFMGRVDDPRKSSVCYKLPTKNCSNCDVLQLEVPPDAVPVVIRFQYEACNALE